MEYLFLAVPVAIICRSLTKEEVFREPREWLQGCYKKCRERYSQASGLACVGWLLLGKLTYLFTCEFCSSFWVSLLVAVGIADYQIRYEGWRGYALAVFVVMGVANVYMSLFSLIRLDLRKTRGVAENIENGESVRANRIP